MSFVVWTNLIPFTFGIRWVLMHRGISLLSGQTMTVRREVHDRLDRCFALELFFPLFRDAFGFWMLVHRTDSVVTFWLFVRRLIYVSVLATEGLMTFQVGTQRSKSEKGSSYVWGSSSDKQEGQRPFQKAFFFFNSCMDFKGLRSPLLTPSQSGFPVEQRSVTSFGPESSLDQVPDSIWATRSLLWLNSVLLALQKQPETIRTRMNVSVFP